MSEWNFIGDVHGDMKTLEKLTAIMPKAPFFSVGDMIDRYPNSKEVLEFFMQDGNNAVLGNHEHFLLDFYYNRNLYSKGIWVHRGNGGMQTLRSLIPYLELEIIAVLGEEATMRDLMTYLEDRKKSIPENLVKWIDERPLYYEEEGLFVSHAPKHPRRSLEDLNKSKEDTANCCNGNLLWNTGTPKRIEGITQIYGHVIHDEPLFHKDDAGVFAVGIDTWRGLDSYLTGLHWPSMQTYSVMVD